MAVKPNCTVLLAAIHANPSSSFDVEDYLECVFGPATMESAPLSTTLYTLIFIAGLTGNIATMTAIIADRRLHTPTNCYLVSLAASDIFVLAFGITEEIYRLWRQYPWNFGLWLCRIRGMASEAFLYISILTILGFTLERYFAIVYPLLSRKLMTSEKTRIFKIIAGIWLFGLVNAVPYAVFSEINYLPHPGDPKRLIKESAWCGVAYEQSHAIRFLEYSSVLFFLAPMVLLIFLYTHIAVVLSRQAKFRLRAPQTSSPSSPTTDTAGTAPNDESRHYRHLKARTSVIRMLVAIVLSFFLCFSFFHGSKNTQFYLKFLITAQRLLTVYVDWNSASDTWKHLYTELHKISGALYYLNPTLNPVLYALHTKRFRYALESWVAACAGRPRPSRDGSFFYGSRYSQSNSTKVSTIHMKNQKDESELILVPNGIARSSDASNPDGSSPR